MNRAIQFILAAMLLLCLARMPYGYYVLVRFVAAFAFAYMAFCYFKKGSGGIGAAFVGLALLFQPFVKVALGRLVWNVVDVVVAVGLIALAVAGLQRRK